MFQNYSHSSYAPAMRNSNGILKEQNSHFLQNKQLVRFVESISQMVIILNQQRQIIYANKAYKDFCKTFNIAPVIGQRSGEAFTCRNAFKSVNGCGTTEACKSCGAVNAILESQKGKKSTKECQVLTTNNDALDLRVTATPLLLDNEQLTVFSFIDISDEKRRSALERVFIHDILNSAGAVSGLAAILKELTDPNDIIEINQAIEKASNSLIEEIKSQREIGAAERGNLSAHFAEIHTHDILQELQRLYANHESNFGKPVVIDSLSENLLISTDQTLLKRILGNMIKNAIEINLMEDIITLKCEKVNNKVVLSVHNQSIIPKEVQQNLFKRFYSTKGKDRGIGTYSMKLFGENYLNGKVWFKSSAGNGTTFFIKL